MTRTKKIWAVILSVAMFITVFAFSASGANIFDKAKAINALETVSGNFKNDKVSEYYYKIYLPDSGKISFHCNGYDKLWMEAYLSLMDSSGNDVISGTYFSQRLEKEYTVEKKGTYYIRIKQTRTNDYFNDFYYSFKPNNTPKITMGIKMKVGDTFDVTAFASNYSGGVSWGTTDKSVATIKKGTVTAVAEGKARIRAYMDNDEYVEIVVKVSKK